MWLVSSMIISIIKFRFHLQSTAQLNYLLSTIVYVPDSKFTYNVTYYNLDMIISLGYRIKSVIATRFRQWAIGAYMIEVC